MSAVFANDGVVLTKCSISSKERYAAGVASANREDPAYSIN